MINLLEMLGGPGRFILGLGPPPWPVPAPVDDHVSTTTSARGVTPSGNDARDKSGASTSSPTGPTDDRASR